MGKVIHKIELPKLLPGEQFSYEILRDGDGEIEGVRMKLEGHELRIEEIVDIEQIYCAKFDILRTRAQDITEKLRKG